MLIKSNTPLENNEPRDLAHDSKTDIIELPTTKINNNFPSYDELINSYYSNKPEISKILTDLDNNTTNIAYIEVNKSKVKMSGNNKLGGFIDKSGKVKNDFKNCCIDQLVFDKKDGALNITRVPLLGVNLNNISNNMNIGDSKTITINIGDPNGSGIYYKRDPKNAINLIFTKKQSDGKSSIWDVKCGA